LDTESINLILNDNILKEKLIKSIPKLKTAICCRVTPLQKAQMVGLVQKRFKKVGLAIGDGANDVPMIDQANIGIGIIGKEGSIAARSSDFAIHRFRHLKRLLAVQGRYSLVRNGLFIQYSFYKNVIITFIGVFFNFFCSFTSTSVMNSYFITFYNSWFNALLPIYYGLFEKDYPEAVLEDCPELYKPLKKGYSFNVFTFCIWMIQGILHSLVIYFFAHGMLTEDLLHEFRRQDDLHVLSFFLAFSTQVILLLKGFISSRHHDLLSLGFFVFSFVSFLGFNLFYSAFPIFWIDITDPLADYFLVTCLNFVFSNL
jgi:phospholipid-transporting ATPase